MTVFSLEFKNSVIFKYAHGQILEMIRYSGMDLINEVFP